MSSEDESSSLNLLTLSDPEGTEVTVESFDSSRIYDAYVDGQGRVRFAGNHATFNNDNYFVKSINE